MSTYSFDTQTPDILSLTPSTKANIRQAAKPWGRLYSTLLHLKAVDLEKDEFKLGRSEECDVKITSDAMSLNRVTNISKLHFKIIKVDDLIYIEDKSKNGTFLNGTLIGRGKKWILQNDDQISIGFRNLKVYVFKVLINDENQFLPPALRKKYQVSRTLGQGAVGVVTLIFDKVTCKPYAVKRILKASKSAPKHVLNHPDKIKSEINILRRLNHPGIVDVHEVVDTNEAVFIVFEYMEGGELGNLIFSPIPLTELQVRHIFYQIALAVQYLHDAGVVHRDLKPENILLLNDSPNSIVKITDFGLSKLISDEDEFMRTLCGTPYYLAPEVLDRNVAYYKAEVDVWSLGVILYYMLSQTLPFFSNERTELTQKIMNAEYSFSGREWERISDEAKDLIHKMLEVDPNERITVEEIVLHPWIYSDKKTKNEVIDLINGNAHTMAYVGSCDSSSDSDSDGSSPPPKRSRSLA